VKSTAESLPKLFNNISLKDKVFYIPMGVSLPNVKAPSLVKNEIKILFSNSFHQNPNSFYLRGGLDVIESFAILKQKYPDISLTLRSSIPKLSDKHIKILQDYNVNVIDSFMSSDAWESCMNDHDIYMLPSARIHIVSLLQAMSHGLAVITSDGWGIEEYALHDKNSLIVRGRYGLVSWIDVNNGLLREDYSSMYQSCPPIVEQIVKYTSSLIDQPEKMQFIRTNARNCIKDTYSIENWNKGLKNALDIAHADNK